MQQSQFLDNEKVDTSVEIYVMYNETLDRKAVLDLHKMTVYILETGEKYERKKLKDLKLLIIDLQKEGYVYERKYARN